VDCGPNPFLVFFRSNKADVSEISRRILNTALSQFRMPDCGWTHVTVSGHADRSGPAAANFSLSRRRAGAIARYLTDRGVPAAVVTTQAFGEGRPLIDTADDVQEPQNRRVEIFFGPYPAGN
jgi:OOP family OmpA-OmpF porin